MVPSYTLLESRIILGLKVTISCHVSVTVVHVQGNNCDLAGVYHTPSALSPSSLGGLDRNKRSFLQVTLLILEIYPSSLSISPLLNRTALKAGIKAYSSLNTTLLLSHASNKSSSSSCISLSSSCSGLVTRVTLCKGCSS